MPSEESDSAFRSSQVCAEKRSGSMEATSPISRRSLRQASNFWSVVILVCAISPGLPTPGVRGLASHEVMLGCSDLR